MYSKTKYPLTDEQVKSLAKRAFPDLTVQSVSEEDSGSFSSVYNITFTNGKETVLKVAPKEGTDVLTHERNILRNEVSAIYRVIHIRSVRTPDIYYADFRHFYIDADYFFMEKLKGKPFSEARKTMSQPDIDRIERECGRICRHMHENVIRREGYTLWKDKFLSMLEDLLEDGRSKNVDIGVPYKAVTEAAEKLKYTLDEVEKMVFLHGDFSDANVLVHDGEVSGIIDFENAIYGDRYFEDCFKDLADSYSMTGFMEGYGDAAITENIRCRRLLYNIYMYLTRIVECAYREYPCSDRCDEAKARLAETLKMV